MSPREDITKKSKRESESSVSEPQPENTARAGRACDDDYPDRITQPADQSEPQTNPAPEEEPSKQGPRP